MMNGEEFVLDSGRELTQEKRGAVVNRVLEGSPAEQGGLLMGDIVIGINGVPIKGVDDAIFRIGTCQPGTSIELEIERDAERTKRVIAIGQRPDK
jgi:serine protease Do